MVVTVKWRIISTWRRKDNYPPRFPPAMATPGQCRSSKTRWCVWKWCLALLVPTIDSEHLAPAGGPGWGLGFIARRDQYRAPKRVLLWRRCLSPVFVACDWALLSSPSPLFFFLWTAQRTCAQRKLNGAGSGQFSRLGSPADSEPLALQSVGSAHMHGHWKQPINSNKEQLPAGYEFELPEPSFFSACLGYIRLPWLKKRPRKGPHGQPLSVTLHCFFMQQDRNFAKPHRCPAQLLGYSTSTFSGRTSFVIGDCRQETWRTHPASVHFSICRRASARIGDGQRARFSRERCVAPSTSSWWLTTLNTT